MYLLMIVYVEIMKKKKKYFGPDFGLFGPNLGPPNFS